MTGIEDFNYPAFNEAAQQMRDRGWEVINPAENHGGDTTLPRTEYMRTDLPQVADCDAILMLSEWEQSEGAKLEFAVARACGVRVLFSDHPGFAEPFQAPDAARLYDDAAKFGPGFELHLIPRLGPAIWSGDLPAGLGRITKWPREERERQARLEAVNPPLQTGGTISFHGDGTVTVKAPPDPFREMLNRIGDLHDKKKADYTGNAHPLANYINSGRSIGATALDSMWSRMNEKLFRIQVLRDSGAPPQNESVTDSYMDVAILSLLSILALTPGSGYEQPAEGLRPLAQARGAQAGAA